MRDNNSHLTKNPTAMREAWSARSPLEKLGVAAVVAVSVTVAVGLLFPKVFGAALGGALTASGGYLLKKAFGR